MCTLYFQLGLVMCSLCICCSYKTTYILLILQHPPTKSLSPIPGREAPVQFTKRDSQSRPAYFTIKGCWVLPQEASNINSEGGNSNLDRILESHCPDISQVTLLESSDWCDKHHSELTFQERLKDTDTGRCVGCPMGLECTKWLTRQF